MPLHGPLHAGKPWSIWRQEGVGLPLDRIGELYLLPLTAAKSDNVRHGLSVLSWLRRKSYRPACSAQLSCLLLGGQRMPRQRLQLVVLVPRCAPHQRTWPDCCAWCLPAGAWAAGAHVPPGASSGGEPLPGPWNRPDRPTAGPPSSTGRTAR